MDIKSPPTLLEEQITSLISLATIYKKLFTSNKGDTAIKLKDGEILYVFRGLIDLQCNILDKIQDLNMSEFEPNTVKSMFSYFYCRVFGSVLTIHDYFDLLKILDKYGLTDVFDEIIKKVLNMCNGDNALDILIECEKANFSEEKKNIKQQIYQTTSYMLYNKLHDQVTQKREYFWMDFGYKCFDEIKPGTDVSGIVLRDVTLKTYLCCEHKDTSIKDYLKPPTDGVKYKNKYVCIAYLMEGNDPATIPCVKHFCCRHRQPLNTDLMSKLKLLPDETKLKIQMLLLGIT